MPYDCDHWGPDKSKQCHVGPPGACPFCEIERLEGDVKRAQRIMRRAISWLQIKEAAFETHKGPAIIKEMQRFVAGSPGSALPEHKEGT